MATNNDEGSSPRTEKIYVLYGSQTGNSEQWAIEFCSQAPTKLSPEAIQKMTGTKESIQVAPVHMQLDDFLELEKCTWTRLMVIITSSYGVGQAPLGCYRYRDLCDAWYNMCKDDAKKDSNNVSSVLKGVSFALCGLGDSKYTTFFQNPTRINEAMHMVGAQRVGPLGKADASGTGKELQSKVVEDWINGIWPHLAKVIVEKPLSEERRREMQMKTVQLCKKINPDFVFDDGSGGSGMQLYMALAVVVVLLAVAFYFWNAQN